SSDQIIFVLYVIFLFYFFFFFQAEDGIRDLTVTGVQTCALPISTPRRCSQPCRSPNPAPSAPRSSSKATCPAPSTHPKAAASTQIGRASCREECRSRWSPHH